MVLADGIFLVIVGALESILRVHVHVAGALELRLTTIGLQVVYFICAHLERLVQALCLAFVSVVDVLYSGFNELVVGA